MENVQEQPDMILPSLQEFDEMLSRKKRLDRLVENEDFQELVMNQYLEKDFIRLSEFLKSSNKQAMADRNIIVEMIAAKGHFESWFRAMANDLDGIDAPGQREALIQAIEEQYAESEAEARNE